MDHEFDLMEAIHNAVMSFRAKYGQSPLAISISRDAYRRLIQEKAEETMIGNLLIGCAPINEIHTEAGVVRVLIDEMLEDIDVIVS